MKYRILLRKAVRKNGDNLYSYYSENEEIFEAQNATELDNKVEELLETYNKNDLSIVSPINYDIDAIIDVNEIYVNNIIVDATGAGVIYRMSGSYLFSDENYTWIMSYDDDQFEVVNKGLSRGLDSSEVVKYNSATTIKAKIKKDDYISEEFILKG